MNQSDSKKMNKRSVHVKQTKHLVSQIVIISYLNLIYFLAKV